MRAVNLLPDGKSGRQQGAGASRYLTATTVLVAGAVLFVAVIALLAFAYVSSHNKVSDRRHQLDAAQQQLADLQSKRAAAQAAAVAKAEEESAFQPRLAAFQAAQAGRVSWDRLLGDLSRVLPAGSWITSLSMHAPVPPAPVAPTTSDTTTDTTTNGLTTTTPAPVAPDLTSFQVTGVALSNDIIARVMERFALVPMLSNITLGSSARGDIGAHRAFAWSMSGSLDPTVPAP